MFSKNNIASLSHRMIGSSSRTPRLLPHRTPAFTIVELLVVIVVIAILATLTIVSYVSITRNATISVIKADLSNANKALANYRTLNDETYPLTIDCSGPNLDLTTNLCLSPGTNISYTYSVDNTNPPSFTLYAQNTDKSITYKLTSSNSTYSEVSQNKICPNNFILVPGSSTYNTSDFCVAKYEMKIYGNDNGAVAYNAANLPTSRPGGTPYVNISQTNAIAQAPRTVDGQGMTVGVGKNLFDESLIKQGAFSQSTGIFGVYGFYVGNEQFISVTPNTTYVLSTGSRQPVQVGYYTDDGTYIAYSPSLYTLVFTTPTNCYKLRSRFYSDAGLVPNDLINPQLELGSTATAYEPYVASAHLITEAEWMTIAQNVLSQPKNWSSGTVGTGFIYKGHIGGNPGSGLTASSSDVDSNYGEIAYNNSNHYDNNKRTLLLSNNETIWDLSGNVWEWTTGTIAANIQPGLTTDTAYTLHNWNVSGLLQNSLPSASMPASMASDSLTNINSLDNTNGIGGLYSNYKDTNTYIRGFLRGGSWGSSSGAGVLYLGLNYNVSGLDSSIGFRVVVPAQ